MKARWATLWDVPEALGFAIANADKGNLDQRIYGYPTLKIMRVENGDSSALLYLPVHSGAILESLGWANWMDASQKLQAALAGLEAIEREAYLTGYREVFFVSSDERVDKFSTEKLGYEKVTALRKRLLP